MNVIDITIVIRVAAVAGQAHCALHFALCAWLCASRDLG